MLLNACIILLVCEAMATRRYRSYDPTNVGTVLFSRQDLQPRSWTKRDVGLLKARQHFQSLLPPPVLITSLYVDYADTLVNYFLAAFDSIKQEAIDSETDKIMTTALSDAVGGYFKGWVLPIGKLEYYGGTLPQEKLVKLYQFYNEIRRYLRTTGEGWIQPNEDVINSITIHVAPLKFSITRSMRNPCDNLAYFENSPNGLSIPMPQIKWNGQSSIMFIPMKNITLIPMEDPDSSRTLFKYYDAAKNCIKTTNPRDEEDFEDNFQTWLSSDVVPHLRDPQTYLALDGVLSLLNHTQNNYNNDLDNYSITLDTVSKVPKRKSFPIFRFFKFNISKKMLILFGLILLELACCIPACIYIICSKKKKDKTLYERYGKAMGQFRITKKPTSETRTVFTGKSGMSQGFMSEFHNFETQFPSTMLTSNVGTQPLSCSDNRIMFSKPVALTPKKSALKTSSHYLPIERSYSPQEHLYSTHNAAIISDSQTSSIKSESFVTIHETSKTPATSITSNVISSQNNVPDIINKNNKEDQRQTLKIQESNEIRQITERNYNRTTSELQNSSNQPFYNINLQNSTDSSSVSNEIVNSSDTALNQQIRLYNDLLLPKYVIDTKSQYKETKSPFCYDSMSQQNASIPVARMEKQSDELKEVSQLGSFLAVDANFIKKHMQKHRQKYVVQQHELKNVSLNITGAKEIHKKIFRHETTEVSLDALRVKQQQNRHGESKQVNKNVIHQLSMKSKPGYDTTKVIHDMMRNTKHITKSVDSNDTTINREVKRHASQPTITDSLDIPYERLDRRQKQRFKEEAQSNKEKHSIKSKLETNKTKYQKKVIERQVTDPNELRHEKVKPKQEIKLDLKLTKETKQGKHNIQPYLEISIDRNLKENKGSVKPSKIPKLASEDKKNSEIVKPAKITTVQKVKAKADDDPSHYSKKKQLVGRKLNYTL